jgi:CRP/FNR family transcriptional regulator
VRAQRALYPERRGAARLAVVDVADPPPWPWGMETLVERRLRRARGALVVSAGQPFSGLVLVRFGSCKSSVTGTHGVEYVSGYHIAGEVLYADACAGSRETRITALEDGEFWLVPIDRVEAAARDDASLQRDLFAFFSREIARDRAGLVMLATMRAEQRLAAFLLDLGTRYRSSGYSAHQFVLRMKREEIGLHLGLSVETVSRLFSRLRAEGLLRVQGRNVALLDVGALRALAAG